MCAHHTWLNGRQGSSRVSVQKVHSIHAIHLMSQTRSSCSALSSPLWWSSPGTSTSTTSSVSPCLNPNCAKIHQQEDYGCIEPYAPLQIPSSSGTSSCSTSTLQDTFSTGPASDLRGEPAPGNWRDTESRTHNHNTKRNGNEDLPK